MAIKQAGECERIRGAIWKSEVLAIPRDLPVVHAAEAQRFIRPHNLCNLGDLLVNAAVPVEQIPSGRCRVEHRLPYLVVAAVTKKALLSPVVDAGRPERAEQETDRSNDLVVWGAGGEASGRLSEGIVVVDECDQVPANLSAVQGSLALRL